LSAIKKAVKETIEEKYLSALAAVKNVKEKRSARKSE